MRLDWEKWYILASIYYEDNNHLLVPSNYKTKEGYLLGKWIDRQRALYKKGLLSPLQIKLLKEINMIFDVKENTRKSIILCELFSMDYKKYSFLKKVPYEILNSKINFLIDNRWGVLCGDRPDEIFYLSDKELLYSYEITKNDLVNNYYKESDNGISYAFKK